ncbi:MAG: hypothetical protein IPO77_01710 [Acidobacteria bacterium]|nr:hypothetical protein [Acidobacteriota bacterium]
MKPGIILSVLIILLISVFPSMAAGQGGKAQLTKKEIILLLKQSAEHRFEQGDIAAEISERGVAFTVDEKTLDEFRQAGARSFVIEAIKRAGSQPATQPGEKASEASNPPDPERPRLRTAESTPPPAVELTPEAREEALAKLPLLEQARYHAMEFSEDLPDFRVTQIVKRYARGPSSKDWELQDTLEIALSYNAKEGEKFQLLKLNGAPTKQSYEQLGGSTSTGDFGSVLAALFSPQTQAAFKEVRSETFNGRKTVVFDFSVKKVNSRSEITDKSSGRSVIAGYSGSVWIDTETKRTLRVELSHENIQPGFPISLAENAVEYDLVTIAGEKYLLPLRAEVLLGRDSERIYSRNVIEFKNYRKFDSDVKLVPDN